MKRITMLMMPLLLTAAFSFSVTAQTETATSTSDVAQESTQIVSAELIGADQAKTEPTADVELEIASEADPDAVSESEEESETESEPEPEPAEPDPFASEPYAQSSLRDVEQHFAQSRDLAVKSLQFVSRARAIIAGTSDNRNFRRHCEYLTRAASNNVYTANVALLVFPRLLETGNLVCETSVKTLMNTFTDELIREPLAREIRLSEMRSLLDSQAEIVRLLRNLSKRISNFCLETDLQSSRRHIQGRIPAFLRAVNRDMIALITRQNSKLESLLNQFDHHYQFCLVNIDYFFAVSDHAPGVMQGAQLGRILRSCKDFAVSLRNYREEFSVFAAQFENLVENRLNEVETLIGNKSRHASRIAEFTDNYPARDLDDMREETFSAQQLLQQALEILDTIREQAGKLSAGEISAAVHEKSEVDTKAVEILQASLDQHLDSKNWYLKDFLSPPEKLADPVATKEPDSESESESEFEPDLVETEQEHEFSEKNTTISPPEKPASDTLKEDATAETAAETETVRPALTETADKQ